MIKPSRNLPVAVFVHGHQAYAHFCAIWFSFLEQKQFIIVHFCGFAFCNISLSLFFFFWPHPMACGILVPQPGIESRSNPDPLHWEYQVLTTGLLRKSSVVLLSSKHVLHINFELNFFRPRCAAFGIEPADPAEEAQSLNHQATRKVPEPNFIDDLFFSFSGECNFLMYPCSPKDCGYIWMYFQIMS